MTKITPFLSEAGKIQWTNAHIGHLTKIILHSFQGDDHWINKNNERKFFKLWYFVSYIYAQKSAFF